MHKYTAKWISGRKNAAGMKTVRHIKMRCAISGGVWLRCCAFHPSSLVRELTCTDLQLQIIPTSQREIKHNEQKTEPALSEGLRSIKGIQSKKDLLDS